MFRLMIVSANSLCVLVTWQAKSDKSTFSGKYGRPAQVKLSLTPLSILRHVIYLKIAQQC